MNLFEQFGNLVAQWPIVGLKSAAQVCKHTDAVEEISYAASISMRSQPKSLLALTLFSSSIKPDGMAIKALKVPSNISILQLLPHGQENIWQFMRQNWQSNRVFKSFDDIVDHCCYAWNTLMSGRGKSCPSRTAIGQPQVTQSEDWYNTSQGCSGQALFNGRTKSNEAGMTTFSLKCDSA
jgi:hypothetical protein